MAVTIKRAPKADPNQLQLIALEVEDPPVVSASEADANILADVGLVDAPTIRAFENGARVRIAHNLYPWHKYCRYGDEGIVRGNWAAPLTPFTSRPEHDIYEIEMINPRQVGCERVHVHLWELEAV